MKLAMTGISISEFCSFSFHLIKVYASYTECHERSICRKTYLLVETYLCVGIEFATNRCIQATMKHLSPLTIIGPRVRHSPEALSTAYSEIQSSVCV